MLAAQNQGIKHIYELTNPALMLPKTSSTFHGRDIFAPAAAHLDKGVAPTEFGAELKDSVKHDFAQTKKRKRALIGEVLHIDGFDNIITNITEKDILQNHAKTVSIKLPRISLKLSFSKAYAEAKTNDPVALIGSHGFMEIALNQGNAAKKFRVKVGDKVVVTIV
jgi:S-adenosylmethionine hydrolase